MNPSFASAEISGRATDLREAVSSMGLGDQQRFRVNVALTPYGPVMACIVFDERRKQGACAPAVLHIVGKVDSACSLGAMPTNPACLTDDKHLRSILNKLLMTALLRGRTGSDLFVRHLTLALFAMGGGDSVEAEQTAVESAQGGLKPWQEKLAKDMLGGNFQSQVPLREVAHACGLSSSHFGRAFRKSIGKSPHRWVLMQRLKRAKSLLMESESSLADIAFECGFCEQSHLTHAFSRTLGLSPGAWRKRYRPL